MAKFKIEAVVPVYLEAEFELDSSELADAQKKIEESVFIEAEDDETTGTFIVLEYILGKAKSSISLLNAIRLPTKAMMTTRANLKSLRSAGSMIQI